MGNFTTNALPWSHFPTFGLIYFVFAQHVIEQATLFSLHSCCRVQYTVIQGSASTRVESVHAM